MNLHTVYLLERHQIYVNWGKGKFGGVRTERFWNEMNSVTEGLEGITLDEDERKWQLLLHPCLGVDDPDGLMGFCFKERDLELENLAGYRFLRQCFFLFFCFLFFFFFFFLFKTLNISFYSLAWIIIDKSLL